MNDTSAQKTKVTMATATPGGGFPFFGDNAAAVINETDPSLLVETKNTKGSAENIGLLEAGQMDVALVAGEPAYEAFAGIGRAPTRLKIISAIYSNPGMFAVRGDSPARSLRDLIGKPIAWGTRASGLTLLGRSGATSPTGSASTARRTSSRIISKRPATARRWWQTDAWRRSGEAASAGRDLPRL
jgi:TRAP transporter TAXI family solute receptor